MAEIEYKLIPTWTMIDKIGNDANWFHRKFHQIKMRDDSFFYINVRWFEFRVWRLFFQTYFLERWHWAKVVVWITKHLRRRVKFSNLWKTIETMQWNDIFLWTHCNSIAIRKYRVKFEIWFSDFSISIIWAIVCLSMTQNLTNYVFWK